LAIDTKPDVMLSASSAAASSDNATKSAKVLNEDFNSSAQNMYIGSQYGSQYAVEKYKLLGKDVDSQGAAPASLANRYVLFQYSGLGGSPLDLKDYKDGPDSRFINDYQYRLAMEPSTSNIIKFFNEDLSDNFSMVYSHSDFMYCTYHGRIPNNYLLTLRRFNFPTSDDLLSGFTLNYVKDGDGNIEKTEVVDTRQVDIARAVTWMSEATENKLEDIIKFTTELPFKEVESEVQALESKAQGIQGSSILGVGVNNGSMGLMGALASASTVGSGQTSANARQLEANAGFDPIKSTYPNYVEGPLYVIKRIMIKDSGIYCAQEFKLNFHYTLRSFGNINPKMALLDIMSNFLVLTYNSAPFWGGATRYIQNGKFGKPLGNHSMLANGNVSGFLSSLMKDAGNIVGKIFGDGNGGFSIDSVAGGAGKVVGDMLGGWLSKNFNTPQGAQGVHAFLSGAPTGQWHLTVGNPLNPIAMIGNLVCTQAEYSMTGPLGKDDFPTSLKVTVTLKSGRDRDRTDIENMFNCGRGRMYQPAEGFSNTLDKQPFAASGYNRSRSSIASLGSSSPTGTVPAASGKFESIQDTAAVAESWVKNKFPGINSDIHRQAILTVSNSVKHG